MCIEVRFVVHRRGTVRQMGPLLEKQPTPYCAIRITPQCGWCEIVDSRPHPGLCVCVCVCVSCLVHAAAEPACGPSRPARPGAGVRQRGGPGPEREPGPHGPLQRADPGPGQHLQLLLQVRRPGTAAEPLFVFPIRYTSFLSGCEFLLTTFCY